VIEGEIFPSGWNAKGVGHPLHVNSMPSCSDAESIQAVNDGKSIGLPTGRLSDGLFDYEYDLYTESSLGSEVYASAWIAENTSKLESLRSIILKSPRNGIHVLGFANSVYRNRAIDDWLFTIEEDTRIFTDVIHFDSPNKPHYIILPDGHNGREFVGKVRTIRRL
jgi:hypothetical protein